ncbi:MAG: FkbM family methyltransferase [Pedobacter sp.]
MLINKRIYQYAARFGLFPGLKLFFKIRLSRSRGRISFHIPNLEHPIFLRRQSSDFYVFEEVFIDEVYKMHLKTDAACIIDAGANIGLAALYFQRAFPGARIISIEPESTNFELLQLNTSDYPNIIRYHNGLWCKKCALKITNTTEGNWGFMVEETTDEDNVIKAISVSDLLEDHPTAVIDILKIDIEGSEKEVFEGSTEWISKSDNIIVEVHENLRKGATSAVLSALKDFSFSKTTETYHFKNRKL